MGGDRRTSSTGSKKGSIFAPEKKEKIKKRWSVIQNNLSKIKDSTVKAVKTHSSGSSRGESGGGGNSSSNGGGSNSSVGSQQSVKRTEAVVQEQLHGAFDYESDENDDIPVGRITSVRVNRTSSEKCMNLDPEEI